MKWIKIPYIAFPIKKWKGGTCIWQKSGLGKSTPPRQSPTSRASTAVWLVARGNKGKKRNFMGSYGTCSTGLHIYCADRNKMIQKCKKWNILEEEEYFMKRKTNHFKKTLATALIPAMVLSPGSLAALAAAPQESQSSFMESLSADYKDPAQKFQSEARWWLAEGSHTDETIIEEIETMHEQGFTGFELCMLNESKLDSNIYAYGSEEWSHDVKLAIETATKLGMSVSLTSGTNWSTANIAGLDPNSEAAEQEVGYSMETLAAGASKSGALKAPAVRRGVDASTVKRSLIGVYAYRVTKEGSATYSDPTLIDPDNCIDLTKQVATDPTTKEETLDWTAPDDGDYILYSLWQQGSFQSASPSQKPAYTINYFDIAGVEGIKDFLSNYIFADKDLVETIRKSDVQFFMDSLEIGTSQGDSMFWAHDMAEEFQARKGYDIRPYLPLFIGTTNRWSVEYADAMGKYCLSDTADTDGMELTRKIRNDLYDVYTQLIQEEMMQPLRKWAQENYGMELRAQISYGSWLEISEMGMSVDYPETETLNQKDQIDIFRLWSGLTHIQNQTLSSETGAIGSMNYALSEQDLLRMSYIQYAAGVNRIIWHGHSSSWGPESSISWPGYEGMFSFIAGRLDVREPNSKDYAEMNDHMGRVQQLLRTGISQTDLGILYLKYGEGMPTGQSKYDPMSEHTGIKWKDITLQDAGYTYDYFSPAFLDKMEYDPASGTLGDTVNYQAILLNQAELPVEYAKTLLGFAKQGLKVIVVDGAGTITPYNDGKEAELAKVMAELKSQDNVIVVSTESDAYAALQSLDVRPRAEFTESNAQILTQTRKDGDNLYLYAYNYCNDKYCGLNHGLNAATEISMDGLFIPYSINSWTGAVEKVANYRYDNGRTIFPISLDYNDVALYAFEPADSEELHVVSTDAQEVRSANGSLVARATESGTYTATLSDGSTYSCQISVPKARELTDWDITVEDWTQGDKIYRSEKRNTTVYDPETDTRVPQVVETVEAKYQTNKDKISVSRKRLATWDKIPQIGKSVSGIGYYHTTFDWDSSSANGAYLDLGEFPQSAVVTVNGKSADPVNVMNAVVDISGLLRNGENELDITVTSTLTNRLIAMGRLSERSAGYNDYYCGYFSNGLSSVKLIPYAESALDQSSVQLSKEASLLKTVADIYSSLKLDSYTAESRAAFQKALADANTLLAGKNASAKDLTEATTALIKAANALALDNTEMKKDIEETKNAAKAAQAEVEKAKFSSGKPSIKSLKSTKKHTVKMTWKKVSKADGYVIQYSTKSNFKGKKTVTIKKGTTASKVLKKLKSGKKYFVRLRAYKTFNGKKVYTSYSTKKSVRVK